MAKVGDVLDALNAVAAFELAEPWDNVGLMVGDPGMAVTAILVALDPTDIVIAEAATRGCNVVVTHHPLIFEAMKSLRIDRPPGSTVAKALAGGIAVFGCHTNLDVMPEGVSDQLASAIGLIDTKPLTAGAGRAGVETGFGRIGRLADPVAGHDFLDRLLRVLRIMVVGVAGRLPDRIETVAVCGGSGSSLAENALAAGADVFVSGEIKHSTARWAEARGFCLLDCGHYPTEQPAVPALAARLGRELQQRRLDIPVMTTGEQTAPLRYYSGASKLQVEPL